MLDIDG